MGMKNTQKSKYVLHAGVSINSRLEKKTFQIPRTKEKKKQDLEKHLNFSEKYLKLDLKLTNCSLQDSIFTIES